jgi:hypothetical protein
MSSPITSISDLFGPAGRTTPLIEAGRLAPPPAVIEQIAQAAEAYEEIRADGHELAFLGGSAGERVTVEVRDTRGNTLKTLSIADAFDGAAGEPLG